MREVPKSARMKKAAKEISVLPAVIEHEYAISFLFGKVRELESAVKSMLEARGIK